MADSPSERPGLFSRLAHAFRGNGAISSTALVKAEPQPAPVSAQVGEVKASSSSLLPRYLRGSTVGSWADFIPLDNRSHVLDILGESGMALVAYWYAATRWRAMKLAEAPLMVVEEDQDTGADEWLPDHELAEVLDEPSPDYDMGELIERTSKYLDNTGACLWVFDRTKGGAVGRITPFKRGEFEVLERPGRLYGAFRIQTANGPAEKEAEEVAYFRDFADTGDRWISDGKSRLDVAMSWLRLSERARQTIRDLLENAVWPSLAVTTDPAWNPDTEQLAMFKAELDQYAAPGSRGKAFASLGGGSVEILTARVRDLVPEEVMNRVESIVAVISGVPAIVLQFQVGMENSPWSQMKEARAMAYQDALAPTWRKLEKVLTRQLLRIDDEDPTHFIRFDKSKIAALQADELEGATIAAMWGRAASLNERRQRMGLEPVSEEDDPDGVADEIPELTQPDPLAIIAGQNGDSAGGDGADDTEDPPADDPAAAEKHRREFELFVKSSSLNERRARIGLPLINHSKADEILELNAPEPVAPIQPEAKADDDEAVATSGPTIVETQNAAERSALWLKSASLNERRRFLGLAVIDNAKADEVPCLVEPDPAAPIEPKAQPEAVPARPKGRVTEDEEKAKRRKLRRRQKVAVLQLAIRAEGVGGFALMADRLLASDSAEVSAIIKRNLSAVPRDDQKYLQKADRGQARTISAILGYLKNTSQPAWSKATRPLIQQATERATAVIAADVGVNFNLLSPHVSKFAKEETAFLVTNVSESTMDDVRRVIGEGVDAGKSVEAIARDVADSGAFAKSRARLIARTEATRTNSGGPTQALEAHAKATNRRYTKTWSTAGDERVRDEHAAMEGETVGISEKFSNGREFPDEPNCRCALIYNEEVDE